MGGYSSRVRRSVDLRPALDTAARRPLLAKSAAAALSAAVMCMLFAIPQMRAGSDREAPSPGFVAEFSASLQDVLQALQDVLEDQTIHGTYVFDKEKRLNGAKGV